MNRVALIALFAASLASVGFASRPVHQLDGKFGKRGQVSFREDAHGDPIVKLERPDGTCEVALRGAYVLSCAFKGDEHPLIYVPRQGYVAKPGPRDFIHGGVPLLWPWFGSSGAPADPLWRRMGRCLGLPVSAEAPFHATARYALFDVKSVEVKKDETTLTLRLGVCDEVAEYTDGEFELVYTITLGDHRLGLNLLTRNLGQKPLCYREGYHPYFAVSDCYKVTLSGVDGCRYESDRPLPCDETHVWKGVVPEWPGCDIFKFAEPKSEITLDDPAWRRQIVLSTTGARDVVTWCQDVKGTRGGESMNIFPDECTHYFCVEPSNFYKSSEITLAAGEEHVFETVITVRNSHPETDTSVLPKVPPLMKCADGTEVKDAETWEKKRRVEIKELLQREEYGFRPVERPEGLVFERVGEDRVMMDGQAVRTRIRASWKGTEGEGSFVFTAFLPTKAKKPAPSFVLICNRDPAEHIDPERRNRTGFWPAERIVARGYAAVAFWNGDIAPDVKSEVFTNGVYACWNRSGQRGDDTWGALSAWAWGASRVLDWIETEPRLDAKHVAVVGHSRGGKTALVAGAMDERFALACSNDSGCGGARTSRFKTAFTEPIAHITSAFPHWFCRNYRKYVGKEMETPFDQHQLVALMAPRLCAIGSATWDTWAGALGEWQTAALASPAWELYGRQGLSSVAVPELSAGAPIGGTCVQGGFISYHCRPGVHDLTPYDWERYMDFADRHGWTR